MLVYQRVDHFLGWHKTTLQKANGRKKTWKMAVRPVEEEMNQTASVFGAGFPDLFLHGFSTKSP